MKALLLPSRWRKLLDDMAHNRTRTLLVVLSITAGVSSVGMIRNAERLIQRDLFTPFEASNPHSATLNVSLFPEAVTHAVEDLRDVESVQAQRSVDAYVPQTDGGALTDIELIVYPDFDAIDVDRPTVESGPTAPGLRQVLLERRSAEYLGYGIGDTLPIQTEDGAHYELTVVGIVHDMSQVPPSFFGQTAGYVSMDTLLWMGEPPGYNRMHFIAADAPDDLDHVLDVADKIDNRVLNPAGYQLKSIIFSRQSARPRAYWASDQLEGIYIVLDVMSLLSILLSGGLVINTISAILTQQVREIGIMRSVGAVRRQVVEMYMVNVLAFSLMALVIAIPAGLLGSWGIASFVLQRLNADLTRVDLSIGVVLLQSAVCLVIPLLASLPPILAGTRISVYDAVYQHGLQGSGRRDWLDRLLNRIKTLTRPLALAVRNTFRNKARLAFTLITLTLAGAMFVSVFSARASLQGQLDEVVRYSNFDLVIATLPGTRIQTAERAAGQIDGVEVAEGWASARATVVHDDGSESRDMQVRATPYDQPATIDPLILDGRWLELGDERGIVVSKDVLDSEPWIVPGSSIELHIAGVTRSYEVVGIVSRHISSPTIYMNYDPFMKVTGTSSPVSEVRVQVEPEMAENLSQVQAVGQAVENQLDQMELSDTSAQTQREALDHVQSTFNFVLVFLVIMALLLALVGGLGLAGTISMNVLERTREIGVLRAVGASSRAVRRIVLVEGITVGLASWLSGVVLAYPLGQPLANAIGSALFQDSVPYFYSLPGAIGWLVLALAIGALASIAPARRASNLTVREVLAL